MFAFQLLADGRAGVGESFKMSAALLRENKGAICLFFVMAMLIGAIASMTFVGSLFDQP